LKMRISQSLGWKTTAPIWINTSIMVSTRTHGKYIEMRLNTKLLVNLIVF
jgi:hypothetical protein